ncbi:unnamed protein product [Clonostachys rosea]|uniref:Uncharacterized protein n=1 Tax=Bionectria ochroleuca TaxID=29856 RepID=A0ABY6TQ41_BIOOC|nr:unnamed protein product [Clonostachys rosea]
MASGSEPFKAMQVYLEDECQGLFIMKDQGKISGDFFYIINVNGIDQLKIELDFRLKAEFPGMHQHQIGKVKQADVGAVIAKAESTPPTDHRTWCKAFIQGLTNEGLLERLTLGGVIQYPVGN